MSSPQQITYSPSNEPNGGRRSTSRSSSFGFLRRAKSTEPANGERKTSGERIRKTSGSRFGSKRKQAESEQEEQLRRQRLAEASRKAPSLPGFTPQPQIQTFGGENYTGIITQHKSQGQRMASAGSVDIPDRSRNTKASVPPLPGTVSEDTVDAYARTESMTHRGRYSYASSLTSTVNSPRRVRRRKDPTPYNILVIGARNSGKTSFLNFLRQSLAMPKKHHGRGGDDTFSESPVASRANRSFMHHYLETEIDAERVGLTLWDSQGLEKNLVDMQLSEMSNFLEAKFEDTFTEEMKVNRAPGVRDTHIHCVFLMLDPSRLDSNIQAATQNRVNGARNSKFYNSSRIVGGLDEDFDLQVLRTLHGKTTVIPVISKADTITTAHMAHLKKTIAESLKKAGLDPLEALNFDDDDEEDDEKEFDEREEDKANAKRMEEDSNYGEDDDPGTPQTDDSDTVPRDQPTPVQRRGSHKRKSSSSFSLNQQAAEPYLPLSVLSPDSYSLSSNGGPVGRHFPWGFADPYNLEHCDFVKLKDSCFGEWRAELREASRENFYEKWRTSRLNRQGVGLAVTANSAVGVNGARKISGGIPKGVMNGHR